MNNPIIDPANLTDEQREAIRNAVKKNIDGNTHYSVEFGEECVADYFVYVTLHSIFGHSLFTDKKGE